VDEEFP
jgi:hypothetical protein